MRRWLASTRYWLALLSLASVLFGFASGQDQDVSWQLQFIGAVKWSTLGVSASNSALVNQDALNALPNGTPILGDCAPGGETILAADWVIHSHLKLWVQEGCKLSWTGTTFGTYFMHMDIGFAQLTPLDDVHLFGLQLGARTPVAAARMMALYMNNSEISYTTVDGSGGVAFLRGSNLHFKNWLVKNTILIAGDPGFRFVGNEPLVPTGIGMLANVVFENMDVIVGDAAFQVCQPNNLIGTWLYNVSTGGDRNTSLLQGGVLYKNVQGVSTSSLLLVNEAQFTELDFHCRHILFDTIAGGGRWLAILGDSNHETYDVTIQHANFLATDTIGNLPAFGIGAFAYGGQLATNPNTTKIVLRDVNVTSPFQTTIGINGASDVTIDTFTFGAPRIGALSVAAGITIDNSSSITLSNGSIAQGFLAQAIAVGKTTKNFGATITAVNVTGTVNGKTAILLNTADATTIKGGKITPAVGATSAQGIVLTTGTTGVAGTTNSDVEGNDVTAILNGLGIVCAVNQGNIAKNNSGAVDCRL